MALYVRDADVDRLAQRVAMLHRVSKTEAVRRALIHELEREGAEKSLVEQGIAFVQALHRRANPARGKPVDKTFIDSLYGDD